MSSECTTGTRSILLIDDLASVRDVLRVPLESEGYSVLEAADGSEGVRLYREHRPAVAIADIVMPEKRVRRIARVMREKTYAR